MQGSQLSDLFMDPIPQAQVSVGTHTNRTEYTFPEDIVLQTGMLCPVSVQQSFLTMFTKVLDDFFKVAWVFP